MKVKAKFSQKYWALKKRLQRLPVLLETTADSITKKDANGFVKEYKDGLKNDNFGLRRLNRISEEQKMLSGYSQPSTPLYGAGLNEKNTYINALRIKKIKSGYRVFISNAKHHEADLPLKILFKIHEEGCLIKVTERMRAFLHYIGIHLKPSTSIIRIPPRPTRTKAYKRWITKRLKNEDVKMARRTIADFIRTGNWRIFLKEQKNEITD